MTKVRAQVFHCLCTEGEDYVALWDLVSVNINAEEGDVFCVYVNLINDNEEEEDEEFKIEIEVFDVNTFIPFDSRVARVLIEDDDGPGTYYLKMAVI